MAIDKLKKLFYYINEYIEKKKTGIICIEICFNQKGITSIKNIKTEKVTIM